MGLSCLYQQSTIRRDQPLGDNTPRIITDWGKRSCPETGSANPFILLDSEATYKLTGVASHAGVGMLRELAERTGLVTGLSEPLLGSYKGVPVHAPGRVLTDLAVAVADGATNISGIQTLTDRQDVFGPVASMPTT